MEPRGLVSRVEAQLERLISLDQLPKEGFLPSEHSLARYYGVSRTTVRQALGQLAARGLVVQRAGRKSRVVALDEAVTLESLGVALPSEGPFPLHRRHLLEGYLALKRQTVVEVLAACCERANQVDLDRLGDACFALREAARWQEHPSAWAQKEFELLRLAARVADSAGHLLLLHSLERSFWAMAERLLPQMQAEPPLQWAQCALLALAGRDAQTLRREGLALLQASDERLLERLAPARRTADTPRSPDSPTQPLAGQPSGPGTARDEPPAAVCPNLSTCPTGSLPIPAPAGPPPQSSPLEFVPAGPTVLGPGPLPGFSPREGPASNPPPSPPLAVGMSTTGKASGLPRGAVGRDLPEPVCLSDRFVPCAVQGVALPEPGSTERWASVPRRRFGSGAPVSSPEPGTPGG